VGRSFEPNGNGNAEKLISGWKRAVAACKTV
jgi:hypothetical protein